MVVLHAKIKMFLSISKPWYYKLNQKAIHLDEGVYSLEKTELKGRLVLHAAWCKGCGICVAFCPRSVLAIEDGIVEIQKSRPLRTMRLMRKALSRLRNHRTEGRAVNMQNTLTLMQGNEACLEGALAAGMRFFAGYPITPSTEIAERAALRLPIFGGHFLQMEDEIASIAAVIGGSVAGVKSMTATSGPGFSLMQENIGYAAMAEVPCVIINVQRGGPSTGLPTSPSQGRCDASQMGERMAIIRSL